MNNRFLLTLSEYERLAREYIDETFKPPKRMTEQLKLSEFIIWLRRREEKANETKASNTQQQATNSTTTLPTGKNSVILSDERLQGARRTRGG